MATVSDTFRLSPAAAEMYEAKFVAACGAASEPAE
jgi:hypothetical protein